MKLTYLLVTVLLLFVFSCSDDNSSINSYTQSLENSNLFTNLKSVPAIIYVEIDIQPGEYPNTINSDAHGNIPVAIFGTASFDVSQIDPTTVTMSGLAIRVKGNGNPITEISDLNNDGYADITVKIEDSDGVFVAGTTIALLTGYLYQEFGGTLFEGTDEVTVVKSILPPDVIADIDGNIYETVTIGNQIWMAENLKVTHYRNGDPIPNVTENSDWISLSTGAYCSYDNNPVNSETYGFLYNWYAVGDDRNIAPTGWHVATDQEWKELEMYLGMSQSEADRSGWRGTNEGGKLKEEGTIHWESPNNGATNESGFTALPAGARSQYTGEFHTLYTVTPFWTADDVSDRAWNRALYNLNTTISRNANNSKLNGFSVRCVKD